MADEKAPASAESINTMPTKAFFVDMLTKDIPLDRAVLDLVDNCIDGAKRLRDGDGQNYEGLWVRIEMSAERFEIADNCGGFSSQVAKDYAFRFGRPKEAKSTAFSVGQFGVGMKRALFKFGRRFSLESATEAEKWSVEVDVDEWERQENTWSFDFKTREACGVPEGERGTTILVDRLRPEVSSRFGSDGFKRVLRELVRMHQRQFIANHLQIELDGILSATDLELLDGAVTPAVESFELGEGEATVKVRLVAGVGESVPGEAGWYVVCNGRVVLAADRSDATGWGRIPEAPADIPRYHNQYARFRGIVFFDCVEAKHLPWNTTKTGVDIDSPVWQIAKEKMVTVSRSIIDFLNELDVEKTMVGKDGPLQRALQASPKRQAETIIRPSAFMAPDRTKYSGPRMTRITYSKPSEEVEILMDSYGVRTAKAVGEKSFEQALSEQEE